MEKIKMIKYKEEIKWIMLTLGLGIVALSLFPKVHEWYSHVNSTLGVGIILLITWWMWK